MVDTVSHWLGDKGRFPLFKCILIAEVVMNRDRLLTLYFHDKRADTINGLIAESAWNMLWAVWLGFIICIVYSCGIELISWLTNWVSHKSGALDLEIKNKEIEKLNVQKSIDSLRSDKSVLENEIETLVKKEMNSQEVIAKLKTMEVQLEQNIKDDTEAVRKLSEKFSKLNQSVENLEKEEGLLVVTPEEGTSSGEGVSRSFIENRKNRSIEFEHILSPDAIELREQFSPENFCHYVGNLKSSLEFLRERIAESLELYKNIKGTDIQPLYDLRDMLGILKFETEDLVAEWSGPSFIELMKRVKPIGNHIDTEMDNISVSLCSFRESNTIEKALTMVDSFLKPKAVLSLTPLRNLLNTLNNSSMLSRAETGCEFILDQLDKGKK